MKNIISIFLALLILLQSFSKVWVFFSFKVNQDYIAKVLCINRDKPEMTCNGKCVLMQRIKAEEEKEKKELPQKLKEQQQVLYCIDNFSWLMQGPKRWADKQKSTFSHQTPFTSAFVEGIFQPPKFVTISLD